MSRTIKRGAPPRRPAPRKKQPVRKVSRMDKLVAALPVSETTLRRAATWSITGGVIAVGLVVATALGVPGVIGTAVGEGLGRAGFRVTGVEIVGQQHMDSNTIRAVALDQPSLAMPLVDLAHIRDRLLAYGWVEDASVSRRLPDTLLITIKERTPAAIWQDNGQLTLIDATGALLDPVDRNAMPDLPLVIGPGADRQEAGYQRLLAAAPALRPRITAATWVGNRRWDLMFDSGETLKLPEVGAADALVTFAEKDGAHPLLGRGWLSFDMRDPTKLVARKPGANVAHALPGDETTTPPPGGNAANEATGADT
jgi:cell division protein FtsQ